MTAWIRRTIIRTPFTQGYMSRRAFTTSRRLYSGTKAPEYYEGRLEGTVPHHRCYILLHAAQPPSAFPAVYHTPISRELLVRATKWGGIVNFAWSQTPSDTTATGELQKKQPATVFSHLGGRLEIPNVSLENVDEVERKIKAYLEGRMTESTSAAAHIYVCTHGARDCRCGERGQAVFNALVRAVEKEREADPSGPAKNIKVGAVGHVGGHKYAANVLIFPHGDWLGIVKPEDAPSIIAQVCEDLRHGVKPLGLSEKPFSIQHWRGRMGMTKEEQKNLWESFRPVMDH